jgi:chaperonin GroEL
MKSIANAELFQFVKGKLSADREREIASLAALDDGLAARIELYRFLVDAASNLSQSRRLETMVIRDDTSADLYRLSLHSAVGTPDALRDKPAVWQSGAQKEQLRTKTRAKTLAADCAARVRVLQGAKKVVQRIKHSLGPAGRDVMVRTKSASPTAAQDAATISNEIDFDDRHEKLGARLILEVASMTSDQVNDGTTTATVIAEAILDGGTLAVAEGLDPVRVRSGIERATEDIVDRLKAMSQPIEDPLQVQQIAIAAANNDCGIGRLVAEAVATVGNDGACVVAEGNAPQTTCRFTDGMRFDRGYLSPHFCTNSETLECELADAYVLVHESKILACEKILPLLEKIANEGLRRPLLIIADVVEGEALAMLVVNKLKGTLQSCAVRTPSYGDHRRAVLEDIAILTGATAILDGTSVTLQNMTLRELGHVAKVNVGQSRTLIIRGAGTRQAVSDRIVNIKSELSTCREHIKRIRLAERLSKLTARIAMIKVGGTDLEKVKKDTALVRDVICATETAVREGYLPGGGVALLRSAVAMLPCNDLDQGEMTGYDIVRRACLRPLQQIAQNAGQDGVLIASKVLESDEQDFGYDARSNKLCNMVEAGIIDPTTVVCTALENASRVAAMILTSDKLDR